MAELVYFIGILFCILLSCFIATELVELTTPNTAVYASKRLSRFGIFAILLMCFTIWGYHSVVFKYFMETEPVVKIETGLKFK